METERYLRADEAAAYLRVCRTPCIAWPGQDRFQQFALGASGGFTSATCMSGSAQSRRRRAAHPADVGSTSDHTVWLPRATSPGRLWSPQPTHMTRVSVSGPLGAHAPIVRP